MVRAAFSFDCAVCGKPLGMRRARQGVTLHPRCRLSLSPAEVDRALGLAQATIARMRGAELAGDRELQQLLLQATRQAAQLIADLMRLRSIVGAPRDPSAPRGA